jgi:hypothetical protein
MLEEGIKNIGEGLIKSYQEFIGFFPPIFGTFLNFLMLVLLVVGYAIFIWKFYKFISKKNPMGLNLNKYNKSHYPFFEKAIGGILYLLEYLIILPFLIFIIFSVFTLFLIILTNNQNISQILIISSVVIAVIRMTSYYKEELSQDIAKMLPLTLLAISVLNPNSFAESQYLEGIINHFIQLPTFIGQIFIYLLFIITLEAILRFFDFILSLFGLEEFNQEK